MTLSDYERQQLFLLEQQLRADDPALALTLSLAPAPAVPHRTLVAGWLLVLCGATAVLWGAYASFVGAAVVGLLFVAAGLYWAENPGSRKLRRK